MNTENFFDKKLEQLKANGNFRSLTTIKINGNKIEPATRKPMFNLSSNDYLGLAADIELRKEFMQTIDAKSLVMSASSSRLLTGNFYEYEELETLLAKLFDAESALVFNCGYHANTGILPAVADERTLILADKLIHASLIDGIRLCRSKSIRFKHNDYEQLEYLVEINHKIYDKIIIVTESIFSMDGDICNLPRLVAMKRKYPCLMLYLDEAHGIGVRGEKGLGLAEEYNCIADIDFLVCTLGKAMASTGAFVICKKNIRHYLINYMRPFIFTTALPPINIAWTTFLFRKIEHMDSRRRHLNDISLKVRNAVIEKTKGLKLSVRSESHIVPMLAGDSRQATALAETFQRHGFYVLPIRPPTVPEGTARLRFSLSASLDDETINRLIHIIDSIENKNI